MSIDKKLRTEIEESILDAQITCEKFLDKPRQVNFSLFETAVLKMLRILNENRKSLQEDGKRDNYKLHAFIPLQTYYMQLTLNEKEKNDKNEP